MACTRMKLELQWCREMEMQSLDSCLPFGYFALPLLLLSLLILFFGCFSSLMLLWQVVTAMAAGKSPEDACIQVFSSVGTTHEIHI